MSLHYVKRTYIDLWTVVELCIRIEARTQAKDEKLAVRFSALIFIFFTLEAYLNHLGSKIFPDVWKNERNYFNGRKKINGQIYRGFIGKLKFILSRCGMDYDESSQYMQTIHLLHSFRNLIVHGYTEDKSLTITYPSGKIPERIVPEVWKFLKSDLRDSAYKHVRDFIEQLNRTALNVFPESNLESAPFGISFFQQTNLDNDEQLT